jgi:Mg2+ and Co2+ transporter CorA
MAVDPFYALTELFEFTAASEAEFLGGVKDNLDDMDHLGEAADAHSSSAIAQSYLLYSRKILEHHMQNIEEALDFIKGRSSLKWPRSRDPNYQRKAENTSVRLQRDFEYLLRQADMLRGHCEREMSILMNTAGIAEAKRGVEHSRRVFKFTLLASFYVPLSFTTSFFGMNFTQLGTGQLSIWVWAAVSLPIFGASILVLFWDPKMFRNWSTWVRKITWAE